MYSGIVLLPWQLAPNQVWFEQLCCLRRTKYLLSLSRAMHLWRVFSLSSRPPMTQGTRQRCVQRRTALFGYLQFAMGSGSSCVKVCTVCTCVLRVSMTDCPPPSLLYHLLPFHSLSSPPPPLLYDLPPPPPNPQVRFAITADTATPTQAPYTEHLKTSAMLLSVAEYNDTQSEEFLQHVAMTIQKGDKPINFWVTER